MKFLSLICILSVCLLDKTICVAAYDIDPTELPLELSTEIIAELKTELGFCTRNEELKNKIEQCITNFESSGNPAYFVKGLPNWDWDAHNYPWDEETKQEYRKYQLERESKGIQGFCSQINGTIECLKPLRSKFESCYSVVGSTLFNFFDVVCQNNAQHVIDFVTAIEGDRCYDNSFDETFTTCLKNEAVFKDEQDPTIPEIVGNICEVSSAVMKCFKAGAKAVSGKCIGIDKGESIMNRFYDDLVQHAGPDFGYYVNMCLKQ